MAEKWLKVAKSSSKVAHLGPREAKVAQSGQHPGQEPREEPFMAEASILPIWSIIGNNEPFCQDVPVTLAEIMGFTTPGGRK